jgi:hypothetical protein
MSRSRECSKSIAEKEELRAWQRNLDLDAVAAYIMHSELVQRPSDYVAQLAKQFEAGSISPKTGKMGPKVLNNDQKLFLAQFASGCNVVWDDEEKNDSGEFVMNNRRCFKMLLIGQGGSGKTALIQKVVLPAIDYIFPRKSARENRSRLVLCATWSQAEIISTAAHKAVSCHRAGHIGIQRHKNQDMSPNAKKLPSVKTWDPLRFLILEETCMIAPSLYNMLLFRAFPRRRHNWQVKEDEYDKLNGAFGRIPIVIHVGDFLQLNPTGTNLSLISGNVVLEAFGTDIPAEQQAVQNNGLVKDAEGEIVQVVPNLMNTERELAIDGEKVS